MKKNIVFVRLQEFPPTNSIDMYYYVKYLSKLGEYSIDVITGIKSKKLDFKDVDIHYTDLPQKNNFINQFYFLFRTIKLLHNIKRNKKIDYVYLFSMHPVSVLIQFYSKSILKIKTIYDVTSGPIGNSFYSRISYFTIKIGILLSDKFILDDHGLYDTLNLVTNKKYTDIGIGYDDYLFIENKGIDKFNKKDDDIVFTYIGTLNSERNLDIFIRAFIKNIKKYKNIKLYFIGHGTGEMKLKTISKKYINKNIYFLGTKKHTYIPGYINSSDILVSYIPKVDYFEYQPPTKLIEYLACNKPVIATDTISQNNILKGYEFLIHQDNLASTTKKITYFIENVESIQKKYFNHIVSEYTWEKLVNRLDMFIRYK